MKRTHIARLLLILVVGGGFSYAAWQLMNSAPQSKRERPQAPVPLVDVVATVARDHPLRLQTTGTLVSAQELDIRPQVGGSIRSMHPNFEPGGRIPAGETLLVIQPDEYALAIEAAKADIAKAQAAIALERGRRVVAREELDILQGSVTIDAASQALALRKPQLRQVQAELAAAQNQLKRAELDLSRTRLKLPFDVIVLERNRVSDEVVAARELVGRVTRADEFWLELRVRPQVLRHIRVREGTNAGSRVTVYDSDRVYGGEVVRIRADLAGDSRLAGVIVAIPVDPARATQPLLGSYVKAEIEAGAIPDVIPVPRRALRDNARVWVVDSNATLQVREAKIAWESGQQLLLHAATVQPGDTIVTSRLSGLVPGAQVRQRLINPQSGRAAASLLDGLADDGK